MRTAPKVMPQKPIEWADLDRAELLDMGRSQAETIAHLQHQLDWFKRQLFGSKSERFIAESNPQQMHLGQFLPVPPAPPQGEQVIPSHKRKVARTDLADGDSVPFFDESKVPVQTIFLANASCADLASDQFEVIGEKVSYRLAQRPGSFVVLKYVRPVVKLRATQAINCSLAPRGVIEGSRADVSFCAGLLIDKFAYHNPLYRQHQKLGHNGITVSRGWLTQIAQQCIALLEPIYRSQFDSICASRVIAMDETAIKAGHDKGKMKNAYFWPVYGERDEVCFPFFPTRAHHCVVEALGVHRPEGAVLLSDGYAAYELYAKKTGLTHAQCWAHTRRNFFDAQNADPDGAAQALQQIAELYEVEEEIRQRKLSGQSKRLHRMTHSKALVEVFFDWVDQQFQRQGLLPTNPFTKALGYARERRLGLEVFLTDPEVPVDTNHLERVLRVIPMGRNYAKSSVMRSRLQDCAVAPCSVDATAVLAVVGLHIIKVHPGRRSSGRELCNASRLRTWSGSFPALFSSSRGRPRRRDGWWLATRARATGRSR